MYPHELLNNLDDVLQTFDSEDAKLKYLQDLNIDQQKNVGNWWIPNGAQWNFLKLVGGVRGYEEDENTWVDSPTTYNFINVWVGANGSGKSDTLAILAGEFIEAIDSPYCRYDGVGDKYPFFAYTPARGRGRIISSPANIRDNIVPALFRYFPKGKFKAEKRGKEYYSYFEGPRGKCFDLMTYEQAVDQFRGATLGWIIFDEPDESAMDIFNECTARLRTGGQIIFTLTPLGDAAWVYDLVLGNTNWEVGAVYSKIWANSVEQGIRGILTEENINRMIAGWDEEEFAARAHAEFMHLRGTILPMFDRKVHVVDPLEVPREGSVYSFIDPHDERPPFIIWAKVCDNGRIYVIREFPEVEVRYFGKTHDNKRETWYTDMKHDNRTIIDYVKCVKEIELETGEAAQRKMDGRFGNKKYPNSGKKVVDEFRDAGLEVGLAGVDPTLERGHAKVRNLLRHHNHDGSDKNDIIIIPRLYITSNCHNTIRSCERYAWSVKKVDGRIKPIETYKDPIDCLRMLADSDIKYISPEFSDMWTRALVGGNKLRN